MQNRNIFTSFSPQKNGQFSREIKVEKNFMLGWAQNEKFAIISRIREIFSMRENSTLYKEKYTRVSPFLKNASECTKGINFT